MSGYSAPLLPITGSIGGGGMGGLAGWGGAIGGLLVGALLGNNGGGLFGNNRAAGVATADLAVDANMLGRMSGIEASLNNIQNEQENAEVLGAIANSNSLLTQGLLRTNDAVDHGVSDIMNGQSNLAKDVATANFTTLSSINGLGRDIMNQNYQAALQNLNSFNMTNGIILQGQNEIGRDAANYANTQALAMQAMAAENSRCCCEVKEKIASDGALTRALINDIRLGDLQTQLSDAKNQLSNMAQTNTILTQLRPPFVPPFPPFVA